MFFLSLIFFLLIGYIFGSLSFAYWIAKSKGVDIFERGSGNPGATNVKRVLGSQMGTLVFVLDFLKGFTAVVLALALSGEPAGIAATVGAVIGHSYSIFLGFRGGKGVAVTMGGLAALMPEVLIVGLVAWVSAFYTFRYVSLASILFACCLPLAALVFRLAGLPITWPVILFAAVIGGLIIYRHKSNIARLMDGTEHRYVKSREES